MENKIKQMVICQIGLDKILFPEVLEYRSKDIDLCSFILEKKASFEHEGIEVFNLIDNIIATEKGYFIALFAKDLELAFNS